MERLLDFREQALNCRGQTAERGIDLSVSAGSIPAREDGRLFGNVLWTEFDAKRYTAHLPIIEFPARATAFALIERDADVGF